VILVSHDRALLRALTTRIWILHERHMTEFAGGFAEWEDVSTERAHAALVSAAEEQALRQLHERQRVAPSLKRDPRQELRRAQRELEQAEAAVAALESEVARVVRALEDPALYTRPEGAATARKLGAQLETLKREPRCGARAVDTGDGAGRDAGAAIGLRRYIAFQSDELVIPIIVSLWH